MRTLDARANDLNSSGFRNATNPTWKLGSPKVSMVEIEILIFLMTSLLVLVAVFGTWRRQCRSPFFRGMLWAANTSSTFLILYILGLIQEDPFKDKLFIIWAMLLLIAYTFPDTFSVNSLDDVVQRRWFFFQFLMKLGGLAFLWAWSTNFKGHWHVEFGVMYLFTAILFFKAVKRLISHIWARPSNIEERANLFESYMKYEHELSVHDAINPRTMRGYDYLVAVTGTKKLCREDVDTPSNLRMLLRRDDVVTLEKVWNCKGRLLTRNGDPDNKLKDICLSFALLKILYLKFAGYALPAEAQPKARWLILKGLLSPGDNDLRAFRVIEVELNLLFEVIYTKYPMYTMALFAVLRVTEFVLSLVVCSLSTAYMSKNANHIESVEVGKVWGLNLDVVVTYILLGMIIFADIVQLVMIARSDWVKSALMCTYVAKKSWQDNALVETLIKVLCKSRFRKPWAGMLGQYSLIDSPGYGTGMSISAIADTIYPDRSRDRQNEREAIPLSDKVKGAVLDSLRAHLTNQGNRRILGLRHNSVCEKLPGEFKGEHEAEVILVLHITTSYCLHRSSTSSGSKKDLTIATDLSNYLAYLVAFAPKLLPGHRFEPQFHFRRAMREAKEAFKGCKNEEDRIDKLHELAMQDKKEDQRIIARGARLGKQLLHLGNNEGLDVWKILAEFWSEMTLCAATSGEVRVHLEKLANGGEFVTHLWALLHHAGVPSSDQPPHSRLVDGVASGSTSQPSAWY